MDQIWKITEINKLHHRELLQQAEQERLARLALQNAVPRSMLKELAQRVVKLYLNLRSANVKAASRVYEGPEMVVKTSNGVAGYRGAHPANVRRFIRRR